MPPRPPMPSPSRKPAHHGLHGRSGLSRPRGPRYFRGLSRRFGGGPPWATWLAGVLVPPIAALLLATACGIMGSAPGPPNLIIVLVDTLRADHLHYAGYPREVSPHIDALARRSAVFLDHYSTASRTGPAVASIFTGLHPLSHGVINPLTEWDAKGVLGQEQTTLAERLRKAGYHCYGFITNPNVTSRFGFGQGFERYQPIAGTCLDVNRTALGALERRGDGPFFLYLHYMEPHSPYAAPAPYRPLYVDPRYQGPLTGDHAQLDRIVGGELTPTPEGVRHLEALYDQEIRFFDDAFGGLLEGLERQGLGENTVIVFVADHGEEFFEHGSALHGYTLYEEQLHVPLFIHDPRTPTHRKVAAVTRHVDLLPTLSELLDLPEPKRHQGRSLVPWMRGGPAGAGSVPVLAEASLMAVKTVRKRSLMLDGWKLIETTIPEPQEELYHLTEDPAEQTDLSAARPEVLARLSARMEALVDSMPVAKSQTVRLREREIETLRSLGYLR